MHEQSKSDAELAFLQSMMPYRLALNSLTRREDKLGHGFGLSREASLPRDIEWTADGLVLQLKTPILDDLRQDGVGLEVGDTIPRAHAGAGAEGGPQEWVVQHLGRRTLMVGRGGGKRSGLEDISNDREGGDRIGESSLKVSGRWAHMREGRTGAWKG